MCCLGKNTATIYKKCNVVSQWKAELGLRSGHSDEKVLYGPLKYHFQNKHYNYKSFPIIKHYKWFPNSILTTKSLKTFYAYLKFYHIIYSQWLTTLVEIISFSFSNNWSILTYFLASMFFCCKADFYIDILFLFIFIRRNTFFLFEI